VEVILSGIGSGILSKMANSTVMVPEDVKPKKKESFKCVDKSDIKTEKTFELQTIEDRKIN